MYICNKNGCTYRKEKDTKDFAGVYPNIRYSFTNIMTNMSAIQNV